MELLVVIAILGLLMALLLPAVQSVRESGRRTQCANNIRQLGVAITGYLFQFGHFPQGVAYDFATNGSSPPDRSGKGWILTSLPYFEQQSLYNQFEAGNCFSGHIENDQGLRRSGCRDPLKVQLDSLHCPSDESVRTLSSDQWQMVGIPVARTSYKGVIGDTRMGGAWTGSPDCHQSIKCPGLFWRHTWATPITAAAVRDGMSNTFAIGEDVVAANNHSAAYYANGDYSSCHAPLNYFPNPPTPDYWPTVMSFRSRHPGGAYFCMADGSLHFISEAIDMSVYQGLATKSGRETVTLPQ